MEASEPKLVKSSYNTFRKFTVILLTLNQQQRRATDNVDVIV